MADSPQPPARVTIKDVARASGVSPATVSFVLNDTPGQTIRPQTRERVHATARQLGYSPHGIARSLREGTSRVVLFDIGPRSAGPALETAVEGMRDELASLGHTLVVVRAGDRAVLRQIEEAVAPRAVVDLTDPSVTDPTSTWTYGLAAHSLTQLRHLVDRGHRRLAFATPATRMPGYVAIRRGHVRQAATALGLPEPGQLVVPDDQAAARDAVAALLRLEPRPTAVAAFDDEVALRVLAALADLGLAAPRDLAVIGFDASEQGALWRPALTTVHIDAASYGRRAARQALGLGDAGWPETPSWVVVRDSA